MHSSQPRSSQCSSLRTRPARRLSEADHAVDPHQDQPVSEVKLEVSVVRDVHNFVAQTRNEFFDTGIPLVIQKRFDCLREMLLTQQQMLHGEWIVRVFRM